MALMLVCMRPPGGEGRIPDGMLYCLDCAGRSDASDRCAGWFAQGIGHRGTLRLLFLALIRLILIVVCFSDQPVMLLTSERSFHCRWRDGICSP